MNLIELMVASSLVSVCALASLGLCSQISLAVLQEERRQHLADRLEGELAALEATLRLQSQRSARPSTCDIAAAELQALLASRPPGSGVQRRLQRLEREDGLLLELAIEGLPIRRQRLYMPAALGLCHNGGAAAATASLAPGSDA